MTRLVVYWLFKRMFGSIRNLLILVVSILIFVFGSVIVYEEITEQERIVIACVDQSETTLSKELIQRINRSSSLEIIDLTYDESMQELSRHDIFLFFVIPKDIVTRIEKEDLDGVISTYYYEENYYVKMIAEVLYSELLYSINEIILHDYIDRLSDEDEAINWKKEADVYMKSQFEKRSENYFIESTIIDFNGFEAISEEKNKELLQLQSVIGMMLLFLGFFVFFSGIVIVKDREDGIHKRVLLTSIRSFELQVSYFLFLFVSSVFLGGILSATLYVLDPNKAINGLDTFLNVSIYSLHLSASFLFLGYFMKGLANYVLIGISYLLGIGIVGGAFFDISLVSNTVRSFFSYTPLYLALNHQLNILSFGHAVELGGFFISSMIWVVVVKLMIAIFD